jgi:hypothetical protein
MTGNFCWEVKRKAHNVPEMATNKDFPGILQKFPISLFKVPASEVSSSMENK